MVQRAEKKKKKPSGVRFKGSSLTVGKQVVSAAISSVDAAAGERTASTEQESWRTGEYVDHFIELTRLSAQSPDNALKMAQAGLDALYSSFEYAYSSAGAEEVVVPLQQAGTVPPRFTFRTVTIKGQGQQIAPGLSVPYKPARGGVLEGKALLDQADLWVRAGIVEPSVASALRAIADHPKWLDLSDKYFVLIGAGAEMSPLPVLLSHGANVIALDLPHKPKLWERLITTAEMSCGTLHIPVGPAPAHSKAAHGQEGRAALCQQAGCNVLTQLPEIAQWLLAAAPRHNLTVGSYAYLDGALHVCLAAAMDYLTLFLTTHRPGTSLAVLLSPTDVWTIPFDAHQMSLARWSSWRLGDAVWVPLRALTRGNIMPKSQTIPLVQPDDGKEPFAFVDSVLFQQGANYLVAKRIQRWRAMLAREQGCIVSATVAPASATHSVMHNPVLKAAYGGAHHFGYEVFEPSTSSALTTSFLARDLADPSSSAHPSTKLRNPEQLFMEHAISNILWRLPWRLRGIGEVSALLYYGQHYLIPAVGAVGGAVVAFKQIKSRL